MATNPDIRPRWVDGEPVCNPTCPAWGYRVLRPCSLTTTGDPCVPALRRENKRLRRALEAVANSPQTNCDGSHEHGCDCVGDAVRAALAAKEGL
jgi:hypothetical protein